MAEYVTLNNKFRYSEWLVSKDHPGLANKMFLDAGERDIIKLGVQSCLDPFRLQHPLNAIIILSGKRSPELNEIIKGAENSDHLFCNVVDFIVLNMSPKKVFCHVIMQNLPYRQLILYPDKKFVHLSWNIPGRNYKHEALILK